MAENLGSGFGRSDFFSLHEQLLGRKLSDCVNERFDNLVDTTTAKTKFFKDVSQGEPRIAVSSLGLAGNSGIGHSIAFLRMDGTSRGGLMHSESSYQYAMQNHMVFRAPTAATVSDGTWCSGLNLGLDNRQLLPPFLPVQRNEDGVFSGILHAITRPLFGHLPWMVIHDSIGKRKLTEADLLKHVTSVKSADIVLTLIRSLTRQEILAEPEKNLTDLARSLIAWGKTSQADFEEMVFLAMSKVACSRLEDFSQRLVFFNMQPKYWVDDVQLCIDASLDALTGNGYIVPWDLSEHFGEEEARRLMQQLVLRTGEMLLCWPSLRDAAAKLRDQGVELGIAV